MMKKREDIPVHTSSLMQEDIVPFTYSKLSLKCGDLFIEAPHRHTFYEIIIITDGEGTHFIDFEPFALKHPTVYFISPGQVHFWHINSPMKGIALMFSEDFLVFPSSSMGNVDEIQFFNTIGDTPELSLNEEQANQINQLLNLTNKEFNSEAISRASVLRAFLHVLIVNLQRFYTLNHHTKTINNEATLIRKFKNLVAKHFINEQSTHAYAKKMGVSSSHLSNVIKSMTGYSPGQLIRNEIILEAKRLLVHTELTIAEIGYSLSFEDPSYFSRFFKRETDMSPAMFRQKTREKYHIFPV
jgi:AraC family transcriptional regulator, transcriptional activator of pobA